eukprot:tig00021135_g18953.t1
MASRRANPEEYMASMPDISSQVEKFAAEAKVVLAGCTTGCTTGCTSVLTPLIAWCRGSQPGSLGMARRNPREQMVDTTAIPTPQLLTSEEMTRKMCALGRVSSPAGKASGFLMRLPERPERLLVVTTSRALPTAAAAAEAVCTFIGPGGRVVEVRLDPQAFFWSAEFVDIPLVGSANEVHRLRTDCAVVACRDGAAGEVPALRVSPSPIEVLQGDSVVHLRQGPAGDKAMAVGVVTVITGIVIRDTLRKLEATAGTPILDSRWEVVAFTPGGRDATDGASYGLFLRGILEHAKAMRSPYLSAHASAPGRPSAYDSPLVGPARASVSGHSSPPTVPSGGTSTPNLTASIDSFSGLQRAPSPSRPSSPPVPAPVVVYVANLDRATLYHARLSCGGSRFPMALLDAVHEGRQPCEECKAPSPFFNNSSRASPAVSSGSAAGAAHARSSAPGVGSPARPSPFASPARPSSFGPAPRSPSPLRRSASPDRRAPPSRNPDLSPSPDPRLKNSRERLLSPARQRGGTSEPADDELVFVSDVKNTSRKFHLKHGCHGARETMTYAQAKAERRSRCPQCFPNEKGSLVSEIRSLSNLFAFGGRSGSSRSLTAPSSPPPRSAGGAPSGARDSAVYL